MKRLAAIAMLTLALTACQTASEPAAPASSVDTGAAANAQTHSGILAFAQAACGGCHAVEAGSLSPNPASPAFADIANRSGLTQQTLATWLRDAHNYPEDMDFDLYDKQVDALSEYILTLRDPNYRAPIS
ncbi:MAG: hypothetical protein KDE32_08240 [Novosphingobium sp.]|nr:hypothetical protein [Novosphingobium sp.]